MKNQADQWSAEDPRLTSYALGELEGEEARAVEEWIEAHPEGREAVEQVRAFGGMLSAELASEQDAVLTEEQRRAIDQQLRPVRRSSKRVRWVVRLGALAATAAGVLLIVRSMEPGEAGSDGAPYTYSLFGATDLQGSVLTAPLVRNREMMDTLGYGGRDTVLSGLEALGYVNSDADESHREVVVDRLKSIGYIGPENSEAPRTSDRYDTLVENAFIRVSNDPRSTFSIDVDTASYANVRRFLLGQSQLPPMDAVRIEELINYFPYDYPEPEAGLPFSVHVEVASAPWQPTHRLVKIGLKGRAVNFAERKDANLVFLLDVSGSMNGADRLPLLVDALSMLVSNLNPSDRVAIVVYAGSSGVVLDSTACSQAPVILEALERLSAGGSTNGGAGIELAYQIAQRNFAEGGINRVILATDGDFNVGTTDEGGLERLITEKAKSGVFLTVLGFGRGNLNDATMEKLADKGNGNYAYIDSKLEARKVLVEQMGGTLVTIAKDVKIQIEFNPSEVEAFRLIGYENRMLAHQDFNDDTKDAGEIGSGHTVTALYEVVPKGVAFDTSGVDPLRYQQGSEPSIASTSGELLTLKLRHKQPAGSTSQMTEFAVRDFGTDMRGASEDLRFAAAVAEFGMLLRDSKFKGDANWDDTLRLATEGIGADVGAYRTEFLLMIQRARSLDAR